MQGTKIDPAPADHRRGKAAIGKAVLADQFKLAAGLQYNGHPRLINHMTWPPARTGEELNWPSNFADHTSSPVTASKHIAWQTKCNSKG